MTLAFKGKNIKEAIENARKVTKEQIDAEIKTQTTITERDLLCLLSFYQYLLASNKDKIFLTTEDSIVWKDKKVLRKIHKCRITSMEKIARKEEKRK